MYKRHFISVLIGIQRLIVLIGLLTLIVGYQNVFAQQQLAQNTYAIFEASCLICHGPDGAYRETLLMEHSALIKGGTVVPGNPNASELYKRLLGPTENGGAQMPLGQPQLPTQSIEVIRRWILAGAPDWTAAPITTRRFIPTSEVLKSIDTHVTTLSPFDRPFARYFTMTHLYNAGVTADILEEYRKALAKLVNSLSWGLDIVNPQSVDPQQTILHIDLRRYEWDRNDGWAQIEEAYPYHIEFNAPAQTAMHNQLSRLQTTLKTTVPSVNVDWFIAVASSPPLYNALLSLPESDKELEERLEVDVVDNILTAPGIRVWRAGFNNSGVSNHNRIVERHASRYGAYWKSYDFAGSVGKQNIFTHPLAFAHDGGEVIFNLPNGLQGYYLVDGNGARLDEAPISIVSNPAASDPTVRNGLSCIGCHTEGMKEINDEVRTVIESDKNPAYNKAHALQLYVVDSVMDSKVNEDLVRYQRALAATGNDAGDVEPVSRFHEAFHSPLDLSQAAATVGLEPDVFLLKIRENAGLQSSGLLVLDGGQIKRDTWTSGFDDIISALDFPTSIGDTPTVTQPDLLPGAPVHIPDSNLRAVIAETLETRTIKAEDMKQLTVLKAGNKGVSNLTGLEYAINLEELWISGDQISDLSPLASCTKLIFLEVWDTRVRDLSPLVNLTNLEQLEFRGNIIDISPIAGLTNLRRLRFYGDGISDISALAGMASLMNVEFRHHEVEDLSPLSKLLNLETLKLHDNKISDLSPLRELTELKFIDLSDNDAIDISLLGRLTNLTHLDLSGSNVLNISPLADLQYLQWLDLASNKISDISPLSGLVNLRELQVERNNISDVSPLSGLVNLERLDVRHNLINDISSLAALFEHLTVSWNNNPGWPRGGPKIEGPWLWTWIPASHHHGYDMLSKATDGAVTESHVAAHGVIEGSPGGSSAWTSHKLSPTGNNNIRELTDVLGWGPGRELYSIVLYGCINLYSPREQTTNLYFGCDDGVRIWINGRKVFSKWQSDGSLTDYNYYFPVTLKEGKNVLFVVLDDRDYRRWSAFFGFSPETEYTVELPSVGYTLSETPIHVGDTFTLHIHAKNIFNLAGWQFDIDFDSNRLEALDMREGDFFKTNGGSTFFQAGRIDNASGKITGLNSALLSDQGVSGSGSILQVEFKAKSEGETELALQNFKFGSITGDIIPTQPHKIRTIVEERLLTGDVNRDGGVDILDLILVARQLGKNVPSDSREDVNGDGVVNIFDLTLVAQGIGGAAAPAVATGRVDAATIETWIARARLVNDGSIAFRQGIANLENLLASLIIPQETALLANYPNPFNPETWIPYQLAVPGEVTLTIYGMNGGVIRRLEMGHQAAGIYRIRNRAVYWDGRNQGGEPVASGLYFYTLRAGEFTATRKMLIRK